MTAAQREPAVEVRLQEPRKGITGSQAEIQFETNPESINLMVTILLTVSGPLPSTIFAEILLRRCISDLLKKFGHSSTRFVRDKLLYCI